MSRHTDIDRWLTPQGLLQIQSWAMHGLTREEIAKQMHTSSRSLRRWMAKEPLIQQAFDIGATLATASVENTLFKMASSGKNVAATIFYLKNRAPQHWSDHPEWQGLDGKVVFMDDIPRSDPAPAEPAADSAPVEPNHS